MIKTRIARTAALATFGLAALGGIALAAPGNADAGSSSSTDSSSSAASGSTTASAPSVSVHELSRAVTSFVNAGQAARQVGDVVGSQNDAEREVDQRWSVSGSGSALTSNG